MNKEFLRKIKNFKLRSNRTRTTLRQTKNTLPRLSVKRSLKHFYMQLIDDTKGVTICAASDHELKDFKGTRSEQSAKVGELLATKALEKKVKDVVFDRGAYKFHGIVKSAADAARKQGLKF